MDQSPKQRRQEKTKNDILDAAKALIWENGYEKLSLRAIARRVDYSPAGLYEYYRDKDEIIMALATRIERQLADALKNSLKPEKQQDEKPQGHDVNQPREQDAEKIVQPNCVPTPSPIVLLGEAYVEFAVKNEEDFLLLFSRKSGRSSFEQAPVSESPYAVLITLIHDQIESGALPRVLAEQSESVAYGIWSMVHGMAMLQLTNLKEFGADFRAVDRFALERLVEGFGCAS